MNTNFQHFSIDGNVCADIGQLLEAVENNANVVLLGQNVDCSMLKAALNNNLAYIIKEVSSDSELFYVHECQNGSEKFFFGFVSYDQDPRLTAADYLFSVIALQNGELPFSASKKYLITPKEKNIDVFTDAINSALSLAGGASFFARNTSSAINLETNKFISKKKVVRHLKESYEVAKQKYVFLELYRALEAFILESVFESLSDSFFKDPKKALEVAGKSIASERKTLGIALAKVSLLDKCDEVNRQVQKLLTNQFSIALKEKGDTYVAPTEIPNGLSEAQWRGVGYIYDIRCAVAHAGKLGLVYEDYIDADDFLKIINPLLEDIVLSSLGFEKI